MLHTMILLVHIQTHLKILQTLFFNVNALQHPVVGECSHTLQHVGVECKSSIKILYFNARSILPKIDSLQAVVTVENPDVICVVETWLSSDIDDREVDIPSYDIVRKDRNRHGGGVCIYTCCMLTAVYHLAQCNQELECIYVTISKRSTVLTVGCFYRPPTSSNFIFDMLTDSIFLLQPSLLTNFLLIGDFNVDIEHGFGPRLTDLMTTFGLTQVVRSPTRISTSGSKTTIDLCFISNSDNLQSCVNLPLVHRP